MKETDIVRRWKPARKLVAMAAIVAALPLPALADGSDNSFWGRANLLGDIGGLRTVLGNYGVTLNITDSENLLGNTLGGVKQGATLQGVTTATLDADLSKSIGLVGGSLHASALQIHGQVFTPYYLDNLQAANGNEAENGTRLWELWYDQAFYGGKFDIKIGQQSIDNEFITSDSSALFVNTMAGWPLIPSDDLYGGGPAYPLASLGVRGQFKPTGNTAILAGVFDDNPGGGAFDDDQQQRDGNGAKFSLQTGALFIAEFQYQAKLAGMDGSYKLGGWYDSGHFPDQRYGTDGLSLADPNSDGTPIMHAGNYSVYALADQTVWQQGDNRKLNVFGRIMGAPDAQNLVDFSFNGGFVLTAPLPTRPNDQAGINIGIGHVSSRTAGLDADSGVTRQGTEELVEATYQAVVTGWLVVQPTFQFIAHPGGGVPDPSNPGHDLRDEFVAGARVITTF